ncbi:MAG: recombinase RecA [Deltaproteobacteria bacterium]|nr:recombinase RecA [Deltaproteobacteria bacterium]
MSKKLEVTPTGDESLDEILGGGIPSHSVVVIAGEPGSGKTVMTLQMLFAAARRGQDSLYLTTLSEPAIKAMRYAQQYGFFDGELFEKHIRFHDLGSILREGAQATMNEIERLVVEREPAFVVIDSFKVLGDVLRGQVDGRPLIYDLAVQMAGWGATTFLVGEYSRAEHASFAEFSIADGILQLGTTRQELQAIREIEVMKLRGAAHRSGTHFFEISEHGLRFVPRVSIPADVDAHPAIGNDERVLTGVAGLDELLDGGLPRTSATVVQGGTGTGKTLLGLQFLIEGARRGEKGVLFTLEETPAQIRAVARSFGWDLAKLEREGMLAIKYTSPVELSTDRYLDQARREVKSLGAQRAVFDSLTTMQLGVHSERRFKELVYAITKYLRGSGVTVVMTSESPELLGNAQLSGHGVSFIADNFIKIRYVELDGRLDRAISVIKSRGVAHDSELRGFTIGKGGLQVVSGRFKNLRGVLTGQPSPVSQA